MTVFFYLIYVLDHSLCSWSFILIAVCFMFAIHFHFIHTCWFTSYFCTYACLLIAVLILMIKKCTYTILYVTCPFYHVYSFIALWWNLCIIMFSYLNTDCKTLHYIKQSFCNRKKVSFCTVYDCISYVLRKCRSCMIQLDFLIISVTHC